VLESLTNDRVSETLTRLGRLNRSEWLTGQAGATLIMAAFCHPAPGGGRFNNGRLAHGIAQSKSRLRSPKRSITAPNASPIPPADFVT